MSNQAPFIQTLTTPTPPQSPIRVRPPPIVTHDALSSSLPVQKTIANLKRYDPELALSQRHKPAVSSNLHYSLIADSPSIEESVNQLLADHAPANDPLAPIPCTPDEARKALRLPPSRAHSRSVSEDILHYDGSTLHRELRPETLVAKLSSASHLSTEDTTAHMFHASPMAMDAPQERTLHPMGTLLSPTEFLGEPRDPRVAGDRTPPMERIGDYRLLRHLGDGAFATVWLARHEAVAETDPYAHVAIKLTLKDANGKENSLTRAHHEVEVARRLQGHVGIIKLLDVVETSEYVAMVMEWVKYGTLYTWCTQRAKKSEEWLATAPAKWDQLKLQWEHDAQQLFIAILQAILHIHRRGFVHRDLKLENILLDLAPFHESMRIQPKMCDFGLAAPILKHPAWSESGGEPPQAVTRLDHSQGAGSDEYLPPEFVLLTASSGSSIPTTSKTDIWSLGIVLYAMLYGKMPFLRRPGQTRRSFLYRIATADIKIKTAEEEERELRHRMGDDSQTSMPLSNAARHLLSAMLKRRAAERIDSDHVLAMSWVKDVA